MPTYVYTCNNCENVKEVDMSIHDNSKVNCDCGFQMDRMITGGMGFLIPDGSTRSSIKNHERKSDMLKETTVDTTYVNRDSLERARSKRK